MIGFCTVRNSSSRESNPAILSLPIGNRNPIYRVKLVVSPFIQGNCVASTNRIMGLHGKLNNFPLYQEVLLLHKRTLRSPAICSCRDVYQCGWIRNIHQISLMVYAFDGKLGWTRLQMGPMCVHVMGPWLSPFVYKPDERLGSGMCATWHILCVGLAGLEISWLVKN